MVIDYREVSRARAAQQILSEAGIAVCYTPDALVQVSPDPQATHWFVHRLEVPTGDGERARAPLGRIRLAEPAGRTWAVARGGGACAPLGTGLPSHPSARRGLRTTRRCGGNPAGVVRFGGVLRGNSPLSRARGLSAGRGVGRGPRYRGVSACGRSSSRAGASASRAGHMTVKDTIASATTPDPVRTAPAMKPAEPEMMSGVSAHVMKSKLRHIPPPPARMERTASVRGMTVKSFFGICSSAGVWIGMVPSMTDPALDASPTNEYTPPCERGVAFRTSSRTRCAFPRAGPPVT